MITDMGIHHKPLDPVLNAEDNNPTRKSECQWCRGEWT